MQIMNVLCCKSAYSFNFILCCSFVICLPKIATNKTDGTNSSQFKHLFNLVKTLVTNITFSQKNVMDKNCRFVGVETFEFSNFCLKMINVIHSIENRYKSSNLPLYISGNELYIIWNTFPDGKTCNWEIAIYLKFSQILKHKTEFLFLSFDI